MKVASSRVESFNIAQTAQVLRGSLCETLYEWPQEEKAVLRVKKSTLYEENQVTYMSDQVRQWDRSKDFRRTLLTALKLGLHKVVNPSPHQAAISLHRELISKFKRSSRAIY